MVPIYFAFERDCTTFYLYTIVTFSTLAGVSLLIFIALLTSQFYSREISKSRFAHSSFFRNLAIFPAESRHFTFRSACRSHDHRFTTDPHLNRRLYPPRQRDTHSETVRADDRAVTESVARSRALYLHLSLSLSVRLSLALPRTLSLTGRAFAVSLARVDETRKNVPRSAFLHPLFHPLLAFSLSFAPRYPFVCPPRLVRSLSSREITPSSSLSSSRATFRTHVSTLLLVPSCRVHARASDAECHAYPFCVRAIDARGKLSLTSSFCGAPAFSPGIIFASYSFEYAYMFSQPVSYAMKDSL